MTYDRAGAKRGTQVYRSMPKWLIQKLNSERSMVGLDPLPVEGRANDDIRFSARQRAINKKMETKYANETGPERVKRLGAAKRRMKNS